MNIRIADEDDAEGACSVLRRSIEELCVADHQDDAETIQGWFANKTAANVRLWICTPGRRLVIAEENGEILGVGAGTAAGEVTLNYVSPDARFRGVSKAILAALETYFREQGNTRSTLISTRTAHQFYRAAGYEDAHDPQISGELSNGSLAKVL